MTVELPKHLETALKEQAKANGVTPFGYLYSVLERELAPPQPRAPGTPFKTGRGSLAKYGQAPSSQDIAANRAEMFGNFCDEL